MERLIASSFNAAQLRFARARAGLTQAALAKLVGVAPRALQYYEQGQRTPDPETLAALAAVLDVPVDFFTVDGPDELPAERVNFRALTKLSARQRDQALTSGLLATEVNRWLEERLKMPAPSVPRYESGATHPALSARRLREEWGLGQVPIRNMVHLIEGHGVRVFSLPERLSDVDAFSFWWHDKPFIVMNTRKSAERGRFDAAHELGHLVMHSEHDRPPGRDGEREANQFASAFLMPEDDVLASGLRNAGVERVLKAKRRWGVAAMALARRLHELGLTSDWTFASTCRQLSQRGYRSGEPDGGPRETSKLMEKTFAALRERNLGMPDVARELRMLPETLRELLFGLTLTAVDGGQLTTPGVRPELRVLK